MTRPMATGHTTRVPDGHTVHPGQQWPMARLSTGRRLMSTRVLLARLANLAMSTRERLDILSLSTRGHLSTLAMSRTGLAIRRVPARTRPWPLVAILAIGHVASLAMAAALLAGFRF
jgi:hypothetical protein